MSEMHKGTAVEFQLVYQVEEIKTYSKYSKEVQTWKINV